MWNLETASTHHPIACNPLAIHPRSSSYRPFHNHRRHWHDPVLAPLQQLQFSSLLMQHFQSPQTPSAAQSHMEAEPCHARLWSHRTSYTVQSNHDVPAEHVPYSLDYSSRNLASCQQLEHVPYSPDYSSSHLASCQQLDLSPEKTPLRSTATLLLLEYCNVHCLLTLFPSTK